MNMNEQIIYNVYDLWSFIGKETGSLIETESFKAVSVSDSDWPNKIFDIGNDVSLHDIIESSRADKLPNSIAIIQSEEAKQHTELELVLVQKNMALDLKTMEDHFTEDSNISIVQSKEDASIFAQTASTSFRYKVDPNIIYKACLKPEIMRLYYYKKDGIALGCGIVFFDSQENAGLHMIGTVPEGRGQGIGTKLTQKLLSEAKRSKAKQCVLHASLMGEPIYIKQGFVAYGELETYRIR